jgi:uncharacterized RDD family membrane protein YckC
VSDAILDTVVTAETPEGIMIELRPAGLTPRLYAFMIDFLIRMCVLMLVGALFRFLGGVGTGLYLIGLFLLEWFYPVMFELSRRGATPGKRTFKLKVVMDSGLPVTPAASITRNLLRVADFLPFMYGFAAVSMLLRRDFKRLGDIAAATLVVYEPLPSSKVSLDDVEPVAPAQPLGPRDQTAVIAFAARAPRLTVERLDELAALAAPVSGNAGESGPAVTRRVLGVAQWLLGRRQP